MAYSKRIPPIKLVFTIKEYNNLIGVLTNNIEELQEKELRELAELTKNKLLRYSIPKEIETDKVEIETRLYINEAVDIISELLAYLCVRLKEIDYYQVLLKVSENCKK